MKYPRYKFILMFVIIISGNLFSEGSTSAMQKTYTFEEFTLTYHWLPGNRQIQFTLSAPTNGWVALGLNTRNELTGTDLTMFSVQNGTPVLDDRYIVAPGNHQADVALGTENDLRLIDHTVTNQKTEITFERDAVTNDRHNMNLKPGKQIWVLLAYSTHPEFDHHSRKRIHKQIKL